MWEALQSCFSRAVLHLGAQNVYIVAINVANLILDYPPLHRASFKVPYLPLFSISQGSWH